MQNKRIFVPEENRYVTLKLSTRVIRTIDKLGLAKTLRKYNLTLAELQ